LNTILSNTAWLSFVSGGDDGQAQPASGDQWIDQGILKPKAEAQKVKLRVPAGTSTVFGGHGPPLLGRS
jgi:hypothetical protein